MIMVYGVILASGVGKRVGASIPKQYLMVNDKPIIVYTIMSLLKVKRIDIIYVAVAPDYIDYIKELLEKHFTDDVIENIVVVAGGAERIDTIYNVTDAIVSRGDVSEEDVVIFHDGVRPFVPEKVLNDSIDGALKYGATVAGVPAKDTMLISEDGKMVSSIPVRSTIFHGQAPDTFRVEHFLKLKSRLTPEQKKIITGTSQFCTFNDEPIYLVEGDELNFKITTKEDLDFAETIAKKLESL